MAQESFNYRLWRYDGAPGELIPLLQSAQDHFGYIPRGAIRHISSVTGVPEAGIFGVITFYSQFRLQPMGRYVIRICDGTACHVSASRQLLDAIRDELSIEIGETDEESLFTLTTVACLGCCSLAPVMMINDETFGRLTPAAVRKILKDFRRRRDAESDGSAATGCGVRN